MDEDGHVVCGEGTRHGGLSDIGAALGYVSEWLHGPRDGSDRIHSAVSAQVQPANIAALTGGQWCANEARVGFTVELPTEFETIEGLLLGVSKPEVQEAKMDRIKVGLCGHASVLIPGKRLWRSAVVTIGAQRSDSIYVLPDMKGIIAEFNQIAVPGGWKGGESIEEPVSVWTSQGSVTLEQRAILALPNETVEKAINVDGRCPKPPRESGQTQ
jgi:hypothetical protein